MTTTRRRLLPALLAACATLALALAGLGPAGQAHAQEPEPGAQRAQIDPALQQAVEGELGAASTEPIQVLMVLGSTADLEGVLARDVPETLRAHAEASQAEVRQRLEELAAQGTGVEVLNTFWIQNMILVQITPQIGALNALATVQGVDRLIPNFTVTQAEPDEVEQAAPEGDVTYGLETIQAPRVWEELGIDGSGVRVATLDTGVDIDHPELAGKMVTDDPGDPSYPGGWMEFDADGELVESEPRDSGTHGTHVSGTVLGGDEGGVAIGVAPGAALMHGLVIPGGSGQFTQVAGGMQWAIDPTDADGNPAGEPADVVSMSLGAGSYIQEMVAPTRNIRAAGVFPSFSIGNEDLFGSCGVGTSSPGNVYEAVGVGATDENDAVADFSCGGVVEKADWDDPPADWPDTYVKPDVSAPGVQTWSSLPGGGYGYKSGTSMAAPHVAGTAALMIAGQPGITVDSLQDTLEGTAYWDDRYAAEPPDTRYGHGRIDAYESALLVSLDSGIEGTVADATGAPIEGAEVTNLDIGSTVRTGEDGAYRMVMQPGTYDLEFTAFGYETQTVTDVVVTEDAFTQVDAQLVATARGAIAGQATFAPSGQPLPGVQVQIEGTPVDFSATTGADGTYLIADVPVGTYEVTAEAPGLPGTDSVTVTVTGGETATADFSFDRPAQDVALISSDPGGQFATYFADRGVTVDVFGTGDLAATTDYDTIVWGYNSSDPGQEDFDAWLAATDASGAGVVFLDQAFGTWQGIPSLSTYAGYPASTASTTSAIGDVFYEVTDSPDHPIFDGLDAEVGDQIEILENPWLAWFDGYETATAGSGSTLADVGATGEPDTLYGGGVGVEQRANNRHVLLSSHGSSVTVGPEQWTGDGDRMFANALDWVTPEGDDEEPFFVVWDLEVAPDVVKSGEEVTVDAKVTNVGEVAGDETVELEIDGEVDQSTTVTLDPGETEQLSWTVTRDDIGVYEVQVGELLDTFRVRPPAVDLQVFTLDGPDADPAPMASATVETVDDDELTFVGETAADGTLLFEAPDAVSDFTLVVRRTADDGGVSYLLTREVTVIDDKAIVMEPRTLGEVNPGGELGAQAGPQDLTALVTLAPDPVDPEHEVWTYLRNTMTGSYGFANPPGRVAVTVDDYDVLHAHKIADFGEDWWYASDILTDVAWDFPMGYTHQFAGPASLELAATSAGDEVTVDWDVTDGYGIPFQGAFTTGLQPFADGLPDALPLEDVLGAIQGATEEAGEVTLTLYGPDGEGVHRGTLEWAQQPFTFALSDYLEEPQPGTYTLELTADMGPYGGELTATTELVVAAPPTRTLATDVVAPGDQFDVEVTFSTDGSTDGASDVALTESIAPDSSGTLGAQRIGNGWPVVDWEASVDATYDDRGTWSLDTADLAAGTTVTVEYTVAAPLNVITPSDWRLTGVLTSGGDPDDREPVGGDDLLTIDG